jgi:ribonuclease G
VAAPLKEMAISIDPNETRVAVLENGTLVELYIEREKHSIVGNVYLAKVKDVLPGMEAAFVDIGQKKNAFLFVDEVAPAEEADPVADVEVVGEAPAPRKRRIQDLLSPGQTIPVQVTKDPMGTKGARVTMHITLPGRFIVLLPGADFLGVSRRLPDDERDRLHEICTPIRPKGVGMIVRTAAEGASAEDLANDIAFLRRLWRKISKSISEAGSTELLYSDMDLALRTVRDDFSAQFTRLIVDDKHAYSKISAFLGKAQPALLKRLVLHKDRQPLFERLGIDTQMATALGRKVWLKSGGYLTIDETEALTAIDVNTGKYVGKRSLEETITKTNLEAAAEIGRQLRLRDIGGIIVLDFIDMEDEKNRQKVFSALTEVLAADRTKTRVVEISQLGLVEMTRKNVAEGLLDVLTDVCPCCGGTGHVPSDDTLRADAERRMRALLVSRRSQAFLFATDPKTAALLADPKNDRVAALRQMTGKFIALVEDHACSAGEVRVVIEGKVPQVEKVMGGG